MKKRNTKKYSFLMALLLIIMTCLSNFTASAADYIDIKKNVETNTDVIVLDNSISEVEKNELQIHCSLTSTDIDAFKGKSHIELPLNIYSTYLNAEYKISYESYIAEVISENSLFLTDINANIISSFECFGEGYGEIIINVECYIDDEIVNSNNLTVYLFTENTLIKYLYLEDKSALMENVLNYQYENGDIETQNYIDLMLENGIGFEKTRFDELLMKADYEDFCSKTENAFSLDIYKSIRKGDITTTEFQNILNQNNINQNFILNIEDSIPTQALSTVSATSASNTVILGCMKWRDIGDITKSHEFKNVELVVKVSYQYRLIFVFNKTVSKTCYTDSNGNYSATFDLSDAVSDEFEVEIVVNLKNSYVDVSNTNNTTYSFTHDYTDKFTTGTTNAIINKIYYDKSGAAEKCIQLHQAGYMAARYAEVRTSKYIAMANIRYPISDTSHYNTLLNTI